MRLFNDDCFLVMQDMIENNQKVDLILTDPPYELDLDGGRGGFNARLVREHQIDFISNGFDYIKCFEMFLKIQDKANILIFCSNSQISKTMSFFESRGLNVTLLTWYKPNAIPLCNKTHKSDLEFIVYVRGKGAYFNNDKEQGEKSKLLSHPICQDSWRFHPTQKPEKLISHLIEMHSLQGDYVFDGFMGSGVVGKVCLKSSRHFIGCEIDKFFFDKAREHIEEERRNNLFCFDCEVFCSEERKS